MLPNRNVDFSGEEGDGLAVIRLPPLTDPLKPGVSDFHLEAMDTEEPVHDQQTFFSSEDQLLQMAACLPDSEDQARLQILEQPQTDNIAVQQEPTSPQDPGQTAQLLQPEIPNLNSPETPPVLLPNGLGRFAPMCKHNSRLVQYYKVVHKETDGKQMGGRNLTVGADRMSN
jgi:hypothetical protein